MQVVLYIQNIHLLTGVHVLIYTCNELILKAVSHYDQKYAQSGIHDCEELFASRYEM